MKYIHYIVWIVHGLPGKSTKERVMRRILMLVFLLFSVSDEGLDNSCMVRNRTRCIFESQSSTRVSISENREKKYL